MAIFPDWPWFLYALLAVWVVVAGIMFKKIFQPQAPPPPNVVTLGELIELFAQLSDEDQEQELAILRDRVEARKQ